MTTRSLSKIASTEISLHLNGAQKGGHLPLDQPNAANEVTMIDAIVSAAPIAIVLLALTAIIAAALYPGRKVSQIIVLLSIALILFFYANSAAQVSKTSESKVEPFLAYYGQNSDLAVTGAG